MEPTLDTSEFQDVPTSQLEAKPNGPVRSKAHEELETTAFEDYTRLTKTLEAKRQSLIVDARGRRDKAIAELLTLGDTALKNQSERHAGRPRNASAAPDTSAAFIDANKSPARRGRPAKAETAEQLAVPAAKAPRKKANFCKICSTKGHDGRIHRFQGKHKKAFNETQLANVAVGKSPNGG